MLQKESAELNRERTVPERRQQPTGPQDAREWGGSSLIDAVSDRAWSSNCDHIMIRSTGRDA